MADDATIRPGALPTYDWASHDPAEVPIPSGLHDATALTGSEPALLPDAPAPAHGQLVAVAHPRIRLLGAYWHEGWPFAQPRTWLRPQVADLLYAATESLPDGFGLAVWDAWRDPRLQRVLHDTVYQDPHLAPGFVALPDPDPRRCPPHASGGTVDLTLTWQQRPLSLGTTFDAFVPEAAAGALEPDGAVVPRQFRRLLALAMAGQGFVVHPQEWWHWEYGTRMWAAVTGHDPRFGVTSPPSQ